MDTGKQNQTDREVGTMKTAKRVLLATLTVIGAIVATAAPALAGYNHG
jgi:hypothetical protein